MDFHGGINGTIIFCSAFLLFAQYFINGQRERVRSSQKELAEKAQKSNKYMREHKKKYSPFAEKLGAYENLMSEEAQRFLINRAILFGFLVGLIFMQAWHTAVDLGSVDYLLKTVSPKVSGWHLWLGRVLFMVQLGAAIVSIIALFRIWRDSEEIKAFIERADKYVDEAATLINPFEAGQKSNNQAVVEAEDALDKAQKEHARSEFKAQHGRPATPSDFTPKKA